jgi:hypothetical protein
VGASDTSTRQPFGSRIRVPPQEVSRVFPVHGHIYEVCCDSGATLHYSLESMSITERRKMFSILSRLSLEHRRRKLLRRLRRS